MMKVIFISIAFVFTIGRGFAQDPATQVSARVLKKMTDSLLLSTMEARKIDSINRLLHIQKMQVRQQYSNPDSLTMYTQLAELSRDSLYHLVLPDPKYLQYLQKKKNLISNN